MSASTVTATADARRLRQVLGNLLSKAIKYNRPGGRIEVAVADAGIGMSPEQMGHLFEPFERLGVQHLGIPGILPAADLSAART